MSTFLRNYDDSTMDLTELAVAMGSLFFSSLLFWYQWSRITSKSRGTEWLDQRFSVRGWKTSLTKSLQDSEVRHPIPKECGGAGVSQKRTLSKTCSSKDLSLESPIHKAGARDLARRSIDKAWTVASEAEVGVRLLAVHFSWKFSCCDDILWPVRFWVDQIQ